MISLFSELQDGLNVGNCRFDFLFTKIRVLSKIWVIVVILMPSFVECFEFRSSKEKTKFIYGDFMLHESSLQHLVGFPDSGYQRLGVSQLGEFWTKGFPELHASEAASVNVGEAKSKTKSDPSANKCPEESEYRFFHKDPTIDGIIGGIAGLIIGAILVSVFCYLWFA